MSGLTNIPTIQQFEQWFANIERKDDTTASDSFLANQFLAYFGLKDAGDVVEFLKSSQGNETVSKIIKELIKEKEEIQVKGELIKAELLRRERLLYILITVIEQDKEKKQNVNELMQSQIDKKQKDTKAAVRKNANLAALRSTLDENILAHTVAIKALEEELSTIENELKEINEQIQTLEEKESIRDEKHAHINEHLDELNSLTQLSLYNWKEEDHRNYHEEQIKSLKVQLTNFESKSDAKQTSDSYAAAKQRALKAKLDHHEEQLAQAPQSAEEMVRQKIQFIEKARLEMERLNTPEGPITKQHKREMKGLELQKQGLNQLLDVMTGEKILLDADLNRLEVKDFNKAHFVISAEQQSCYQKHEGAYVYLPGGIEANDYSEAKEQFNKLKSEIRVVHSYQHERRQLKAEALRNSIQDCKYNRLQRQATQRQLFDALQTQKTNLSQLKSWAPEPKPQPQSQSKDVIVPQSSYSLMMGHLERLIPTDAPSPPKEALRQVLKAIVPSPKYPQLERLLDEVKPGKIMPFDERLSWFRQVRTLITEPELSNSEELDLKPKAPGPRIY